MVLNPERIMSFVLEPWQLLLIILAGWINPQQQTLIEFQPLQIEALLKQLGKKRILLSDDQRKLLAVKGKTIGRKGLKEVSLIVTPDTILRWHRKLVAQKWDYTERRKTKPGRPQVSDEIKKLVLQMAKQNPSWGYDRIVGALANLGLTVSAQTVGNVLKRHGIAPAPERKTTTTWKEFIRTHMDVPHSIGFSGRLLDFGC
jgi:transposase